MSRSSADTQNVSYIEWGPVIAGSAIALAITAILIPFGNALGLSVTNPLQGYNPRGIIFGVGLWILWVQLISSILGGYFAGRTLTARGGGKFDSEFRDGAHGLLSWCVATILTGAGVAVAGFFAAIAPEQANDMKASEELVRQAAVILGFTLAASSIVSAVAAWIMATVGGDHRDNNTDLSKFFSFRQTGKKK
jgi:ABC-type nickel/cobalt efflux system permease component RcnA